MKVVFSTGAYVFRHMLATGAEGGARSSHSFYDAYLISRGIFFPCKAGIARRAVFLVTIVGSLAVPAAIAAAFQCADVMPTAGAGVGCFRDTTATATAFDRIVLVKHKYSSQILVVISAAYPIKIKIMVGGILKVQCVQHPVGRVFVVVIDRVREHRADRFTAIHNDIRRVQLLVFSLV